MAFSKPALGKRGYNEDEVDAFLDLVDAARRDATGHTLTPDQVRNMAFSKPALGKRGYNEDEVDAFLDLVEEEMRGRVTSANQGFQQGAFPPPPRSLGGGGVPAARETDHPYRGNRARLFAINRRTRRSSRWFTIVGALILGGISLWVIATSGYGLWVLQFGTPTSVELVHCNRHAGTAGKGSFLPTNCTGLWRQDDGSVRTVTVHSPPHIFNQNVDVRVRGGQAYTSWSAEVVKFLAASAFLGVVLWCVLPDRPSRASPTRHEAPRSGDAHGRQDLS